MTTLLFLHADERSAFEQLPADIREGWDVQDEALETYESVRQITLRYGMGDFGMHPSVRTIVDQIEKGVAPDAVSIAELGPDIQKELYFMIGARGVRSLMRAMLPNLRTDQDIEAYAALSVVRHKLLELNSSSARR